MKLLLLMALLACTIALPACNILSFATVALTPPQPIKALYKPAQKPTLVLVENYRYSGTVPIGDQLAYFTTEELRAGKVAPLIEQEKLQSLRDKGWDAYQKMHVSEIGKALGAEQVVYVDLKDCKVDLIPGSEFMSGRIIATVKLIDTTTGQTLFPNNLIDGQPYTYETKMMRKGTGDSPEKLRNQMLQQAGSEIGRFFYDYTPPDAY